MREVLLSKRNKKRESELEYTRKCEAVNRQVVIDSRFSIAYVVGMGQLSSALREAIRVSGQTQAEIAEAVGISDGILSRFMRAERSMNLATAEKLAEYFSLELRKRVERKRKHP